MTSGPPRLSQRSLPQLPLGIKVPGYDRSRLPRSIVHIGVGGFHRAHVATYISDLAERGHTAWGIGRSSASVARMLNSWHLRMESISNDTQTAESVQTPGYLRVWLMRPVDEHL